MKPWAWFLVLVLAIAGLVGWRIKTNSGTEQGARRGRQTPTVEVATAGQATVKDTIQAVGSLESPQRVELSPKSSGRIEFLQAREGDRVTAGQVLARIDPSEANAQVVSAKAALAAAQSRLAEAKLQQDPNSVAVTSQVERGDAGVKSAEAALEQVKSNSESQIEAAKMQVTDSDAKLKTADSQVTNAEAVLGREQASLKNLQIKLDRTRELYKQGFIAAQDVDDAKTAVEVQQNNVKVAESQLAAAKQARTSAQAQLDVSKLQLSIAQKKATADVAAAEAAAVEAKTGLKVAQSNEAQNPAYQENLAALGSAVEAAKAQLDLAQAALANTVLTSPIDGVVTARNADPGTLATPGQPVLEVQSLGWLFFKSSLPIETAPLVSTGQSVEVSIDGIDGRTFSGTVSNVNLVADPQSRQFSIQIRLDNPEDELRPGMFGRVSIVTKEVRAKVAVPKEAVEVSEKGSTVTVIDNDMKAEVRNVETGASDGNMVEVTSGVEPGEKVVTLSFQKLRDGQTVALPQKKTGRPAKK